jgi:DNA-binding NarL/FixJ family response regulator
MPNPKEANATIAAPDRDIVVLESNAAQSDESRAVQEILKYAGNARIVIVISNNLGSDLRRALKMSPLEALLKSELSGRLPDKPETIHPKLKPATHPGSVDQASPCPEVTDAGVSLGQQDAATLTDRERVILQMVVEGKKSKEIAMELMVTVRTVESHRASIMRKLDLHSVAALIRFAIHNKIVNV